MKSKYFTATAFAMAVALALAACDSGPDRLPIHSEVTWQDGREPSGPYEDLPYVQVAREWDIHERAAQNALNYSSAELARTSADPSRPGNMGGVLASIRREGLTLWEGPLSFSVLDVEEDKDRVRLEVCAQRPAWWALDGTRLDRTWVVEENDDILRFEMPDYGLGYFTLVLDGEGQ